jgi:predicted nucleic acid-binding protein
MSLTPNPPLNPEMTPFHVPANKKDIAGFMAACASAAEAVEVHFLWRPQLADFNDDIVLEAAVNGRAKAIVTYNVRHFEPAAGQFEFAVVTPGTFLKRIKT